MERDEEVAAADRREGRGGPLPALPAPVVAAVAARPWLWATALTQLVRLAPRGWWRRRPHLPVPDPGYLAFRLQTQYGDSARPPEAGDVVTYLEWCRRSRRARG